MRSLLQFTLDLFDEQANGAAPAHPSSKPPSSRAPVPKPPPVAAGALSGIAPALSLAEAVAPAQFIHPRVARG